MLWGGLPVKTDFCLGYELPSFFPPTNEIQICSQWSSQKQKESRKTKAKAAVPVWQLLFCHTRFTHKIFTSCLMDHLAYMHPNPVSWCSSLQMGLISFQDECIRWGDDSFSVRYQSLWSSQLCHNFHKWCFVVNQHLLDISNYENSDVLLQQIS